jgi:hypothetical protein
MKWMYSTTHLNFGVVSGQLHTSTSFLRGEETLVIRGLTGWVGSSWPESFGEEIYLLNFIFGRASDLYLCLYNQLFALFHCVLSF